MIVAKYAHAEIRTTTNKNEGTKTPLIATVFDRLFITKPCQIQVSPLSILFHYIEDSYQVILLLHSNHTNYIVARMTYTLRHLVFI